MSPPLDGVRTSILQQNQAVPNRAGNYCGSRVDFRLVYAPEDAKRRPMTDISPAPTSENSTVPFRPCTAG